MNIELISTAYAAAAAPAQGAGEGFTSILLLLGFVVIFYFLLWRPQSKRAKEQRQLISSLASGDEVITSGGILGKITKVSDDFVVLEIADGVEIRVQKPAVVATVPKGTMNSTNNIPTETVG